MHPRITVLLFVKANAATPVEKMITDAQCAAALDTLERLNPLEEIGEIIVATNDSKFAVQAARRGARIEMDRDNEDFHWGERLAGLAAKYRAGLPFYIGGGSGVFMRSQDWHDAFKILLREKSCVVTNNFFSCDFAGWSPREALDKIQVPDIDNNLAFRLGEQAGLRAYALPKNATTQLDLDTPTDLMTIQAHPGVGEHLSEFLKALDLDTHRVRQVQTLFKNRDATLLLTGRVAGSLANLLESATRCQWRFISEERGMRASGREDRGEVRSLIGFHLERVGALQWIAQIAETVRAAIIDTRVLFAHARLKPTASDRFYSDLLQPENIDDPFIRDFTRAARDAPIPILLGGHSLVAGGMYTMIETASVV